MKTVTFHQTKNGETAKWVDDFLGGKRHIPKQNHGSRRGIHRTKLQQQRQTLGIVEDFGCEDKNLRILQRFRMCLIFLHFATFRVARYNFTSSKTLVGWCRDRP